MKTTETASGSSASVALARALRPKTMRKVVGNPLDASNAFHIGQRVSNEWKRNEILAVEPQYTSRQFACHNSSRCLPQRIFPPVWIFVSWFLRHEQTRNAPFVLGWMMWRERESIARPCDRCSNELNASWQLNRSIYPMLYSVCFFICLFFCSYTAAVRGTFVWWGVGVLLALIVCVIYLTCSTSKFKGNTNVMIDKIF